MNRERVSAMMRWLVDEGHMTPVAVRQLNAVLDAEEAGASPFGATPDERHAGGEPFAADEGGWR